MDRGQILVKGGSRFVSQVVCISLFRVFVCVVNLSRFILVYLGRWLRLAPMQNRASLSPSDYFCDARQHRAVDCRIVSDG